MKFVPVGPIVKNWTLVPLIALHLKGNKFLPEPMITFL